MQFKLALGQLQVDPGVEAENRARALAVIGQAARNAAQVVLLPEALPFGWTDPSAVKHAESVPAGPHCAELRQAARQHGVYVCAGLVERAGENLFNAAVLISPRGEVLLHHRKIYELEIAQGLYSLGDHLAVARTDLGVIGLMVCADGFAPGQAISRTLALMGADVILSPCAWAVPSNHDNNAEPYGALWIDNYGPVAREFGVWIAGCSNVGPIRSGPWKGRKCIGSSMVVGPDGQVAARAPYGEGAAHVLYAEITTGKRATRCGP